MIPSKELSELRGLSGAIGSDIRLVQGPGGNTSIKDDAVLWVKASGMWLADAEHGDIFLSLELDVVRRRISAEEDDCGAGAMINGDKRRASIETSMHAILPQRVVLHVHCVDTIRWAVLRDGRDEIAGRLDGLSWAWIPYRRPGLPLARKIALDCAARRDVPDILILENHGLVVCGASCDEAGHRLKDVCTRLAVAPRSAAPPGKSGRPAAPFGYRWVEDAAISSLACDPVGWAAARRGVLYPDHAVFLGSGFPEVQSSEGIAETLARWQAAYGRPPTYLVVPEAGVLIGEQASSSVVAMLYCLTLVTARIAPTDVTNNRLRYLSAADVAALTDWDLEAYRQQHAKCDRPG